MLQIWMDQSSAVDRAFIAWQMSQRQAKAVEKQTWNTAQRVNYILPKPELPVFQRWYFHQGNKTVN